MFILNSLRNNMVYLVLKERRDRENERQAFKEKMN